MVSALKKKLSSAETQKYMNKLFIYEGGVLSYNRGFTLPVCEPEDMGCLQL